MVLCTPQRMARNGLSIEERFNNQSWQKKTGMVFAYVYKNIKFPPFEGANYGTIDQFVVYALRKLELTEQCVLEKMNPQGLTVKDAVELETILRRKAMELNKKFNTTNWNPKRIDMVLWTYRENLTAYNSIASVIEEYGAYLTEKERNRLAEKILRCKG